MFKIRKVINITLLVVFFSAVIVSVDNTESYKLDAKEEIVSVFKIVKPKKNLFALEDKNKKESIKVYPGGNAVALKMNTDGVLVLNIGHIQNINGDIVQPSKEKLKVGDIIYKVNDKTIQNKEQLRQIVKETKEKEEVIITINRTGEIKDVSIIPIKVYGTEEKKIGVWVRDSTQGIGTITYVSEDMKTYGALGHGILDIDTKQLMKVKDGEVSFTNIVSINKGRKGSPGELIGEIKGYEKLGTIEKNTRLGVLGYIDEDTVNREQLNKNLMEIGYKEEVKVGKATILSNINNEEIKEYEIFIDKVDIKSKDGKGITLTIIGDELIEKTGGIVHGMSGSPILQNGKIIGAVTHVFVQNPEKGYGIFIEDMLRESEMKK